MTQHDMNLANQSGSLFRADLNDMASAIATNNSGASAPTTTYAYMWWADTTNGWLQQRNSANTDWIKVMRLADTAPIRRPIQSKSGTYTILETEIGNTFRATTTLTFNLTAAATLGSGWWCFVNADSGTVTIDPNGTEQINGATTATLIQGSWMLIICDGSNFRGYTQGASPGLVKLNSGTVSGAATLDIVMTAYTTYPNKLLVIDVIPVTDAVIPVIRFSSNGGSTYDAGGTDYGWEASVGGATTTTNDSAIQLSSGGSVGNATTEGIGARIVLYDTTSTAKWTKCAWEAVYIDSAGTPVVRAPHGTGARRAAQDTDAVRLLFSSGNISSGTWALYGWT